VANVRFLRGDGGEQDEDAAEILKEVRSLGDPIFRLDVYQSADGRLVSVANFHREISRLPVKDMPWLYLSKVATLASDALAAMVDVGRQALSDRLKTHEPPLPPALAVLNTKAPVGRKDN
jgi:hypothetical protein